MALAAELQLQAHVVEKDYALGWFLAGIAAHPEIGPSWVFKGGTCLKKCYFETYRFSEDLDFTLKDAEHLDEAFLARVFEEIRHATTDVAHGSKTTHSRRKFSRIRAVSASARGAWSRCHTGPRPRSMAEYGVRANRSSHS